MNIQKGIVFIHKDYDALYSSILQRENEYNRRKTDSCFF